MNVIQISATQLAQLIRKKEISAVEVTQRYIDQINRVNSKINALILFKPEEALAQARDLDECQAQDKPLGPLHGVPFTVKDIFNTAGDVTTAGSLGLKNYVAKDDATLVKRLRAAGAIFLGKTNTPEFENSADTDNLIFGKTANPYRLTHSAGGSSGGSGAAVAACCSAFDIGADHGGSLRIPAHYNGITTLRSTIRQIPSTGVVYGVRKGLGAIFNTEGPLTRYIDDLPLILSVIRGPDGIDPNIEDNPVSYATDLDVTQFRFAFFYDDGNTQVMPEVKAAVRNAALILETLGATTIYDQPARIGEGFEIYQELSGPNARRDFKSLFDYYKISQRSPLIEKQMQNFAPYDCDLETYLQRWQKWDDFRGDILKFFQHYDAFICPVTAQDALPLSTPMWEGQVNLLSFCWDVSAALLPAVVVRAGTSPTGLPIGIQIVTKPKYEAIALSAAKQIEKMLGGWKMPSFCRQESPIRPKTLQHINTN